MRKLEFQNGEYYHILNRGVDKRVIFDDEKDYIRFLRSMREFNVSKQIGGIYNVRKMNSGEQSEASAQSLNLSNEVLNNADIKDSSLLEASDCLVEIIAYSLLPNHFHLILKQSTEHGISKFMQKISMGYANYYNLKNRRSGRLFQGKFKSIHINEDGYFLWVSGYINGNPEIHKIVKAEVWPWSSYMDYLGLRKGTLPDKNVIMKEFKDINEYREFTEMIIRESRQKKVDIKQYCLE